MVVDQGIGLVSQNLYQNQRVLRRSIYIVPVITSREECNVFADLFLGFIHVFRFCQPSCFFAAWFTLRQPKTPVRNTTNLRTFFLKTIIMPFKRVFVLWHSLIRSLHFIQVFIFIPVIHSAPFLRFSHILLYTNFFLCILLCEIFFLSLMTLLLGI